MTEQREVRAMTPLEATLAVLARMSEFERGRFFDGLREAYCVDCGSEDGWKCYCKRDD